MLDVGHCLPAEAGLTGKKQGRAGDPQPSGAAGRVVRELVILLFCGLFAVYFAGLRLKRPTWEPVTFERMVAGTARTPFQYRVLLPWTYQSIVASGLGPNLTPRAFCLGAEAAAAFLLLLAFRAYLGCFIRERSLRDLLLPVMALALPFNYLLPPELGFYYPYDVPSVFFFTLGLFLLRRRKWLLYYPVFALATLNRETTCFLTVVYVLVSFGKERVWRLACHVLAQAALWLLIKRALHDVYGGDLHYWHVPRNFYLLRLPVTWPLLLSAMGYTWLPVLLGWRRIRDDFARRACLVAPLFALGMALVALITEVRLYGELLPICLVGWVLVVRDTRRAEPSG